MLADTSQIHDFSVAQHRHSSDLTVVAADLLAAHVPEDAFGTVGTHFTAALNAALTQQAQHVTHVAERLSIAAATSRRSANAYDAAEAEAGQTITTLGS